MPPAAILTNGVGPRPETTRISRSTGGFNPAALAPGGTGLAEADPTRFGDNRLPI